MNPRMLYLKSKDAAHHVYERRARYAAGATFVATVVMFNKLDRVEDWNAFLEEKGLLEEFYTPVEIEI